MIDFTDNYYYGTAKIPNENSEKELARKKAFSAVIPLIMENELTPRQNMCIKYKYLENKTQEEIAELLKLSQPTVSRHISTAKAILNNSLSYCYLALAKGIDEYDRLTMLC